MFRFTIRDLLWLMVVVGLLAAWLSDRNREHYAWESLLKKDRISSSRIRSAQREAQLAVAEKERLEEVVQEKQLQIEQLLTTPVPVSHQQPNPAAPTTTTSPPVTK